MKQLFYFLSLWILASCSECSKPGFGLADAGANSAYRHCLDADSMLLFPGACDGSDSLLLASIDDKACADDPALRAEAYYYKGKFCRKQNDALKALDYYHKSLDELGKAGVAQCGVEGEIYAEMGHLYADQKLYAEALKAYKKALSCDSLANDSSRMLYSLCNVAETYYHQNDLFNSLLYYQRACDWEETLHEPGMLENIQSKIAFVYLEIGSCSQMSEALGIARKSTDKDILRRVYIGYAELFYRTGAVDSSYYYSRKALQCGTVYTQVAAYGLLSRMAMENGQYDSAMAYVKAYKYCLDSIQAITDIEAIRKVNALYDYGLREKENMQLREENVLRKTQLLLLLAGCALLLILLLVYRERTRRKYWQMKYRVDALKQLQEKQYRQSRSFVEQNNRKIAELERQLQDSHVQNQTMERQLQRQKEIILCMNKQTEAFISAREEAEKEFFSSKLYTDLHTCPDMALYAKDWKMLQEYVDSAYDGFTQKLLKVCSLTANELHVCLLLKSNVPLASIARLTHHSREAVTATRRRLYEKFFNTKGAPKQWDDFIASL